MARKYDNIKLVTQRHRSYEPFGKKDLVLVLIFIGFFVCIALLELLNYIETLFINYLTNTGK